MICIVRVQGSRSGGAFCVNLGLHPSSLPTILFHDAVARNMSDADCAFRGRLTARGSAQWWPYDDQSSLDAALDDASRVYMTSGRAIFAAHTATDALLLTVTPTAFVAGTLDLKGLAATEFSLLHALARLRQAAGKHEEAAAFARLALANSGPVTILRDELQAIADGRPSI